MSSNIFIYARVSLLVQRGRGLTIGTFSGPRYKYVHQPLYWYKEVARARASLLVQYTDIEVCTDKFYTDGESDRGSRYWYCTNNETLVYYKFRILPTKQ